MSYYSRRYKKRNKTLKIERKFDLWDDLVDRSLLVDPVKFPDRGCSRREGNKREDWSGTPNFESAVKLLKEGWPEGRKKILNIKDQIEDDLVNQVKTININYDVVGEQVDVGLFLAGEPECMAVFDNKEGMGKGVVKIMVNITASANINKQLIINRGAAA